MKFRKYIKSVPAIALSFLLLFAGMWLSSCEEEGEDPNKIVLKSFGPSGVKHGENIIFIGSNLDKVTAIVMPGGVEIPSSAFVSATATQLEITVPDGTEEGTVTLKTPQGDIVSKSVFSLDVPVEIASYPAEGKPGTNITFSGTYMNWVKSITFNSDQKVKATDFVSVSETEVVVTIPEASKTGKLVFELGGTSPMTVTTEDDFIVTLPEITGMTSSVLHTEDITVTGTDLDLITKITFPGGDVVTTFVSQSETEIVVTLPATAHAGAITCEVASGLTVVSPMTYSLILPNATALSPASTSSHTAGTELTITGTNLDLVAEIAFPGADANILAAEFTSHSSTQIVVDIPDPVQGGTVTFISIHGYPVPVELPFGDQLTLGVVFYDDALNTSLWQQWGGWGGTYNDASTGQVRIGASSIQVNFGGSYSAPWQIGGGTASTSGYSFFAFSAYGGAGTDGENIAVTVKGGSPEQTTVTLVEGAWTDFQIPLSTFGNPATVTEIFIQDQDWTGTVYFDQIGLK